MKLVASSKLHTYKAEYYIRKYTMPRFNITGKITSTMDFIWET
jgi:hypothetical protein